MWRLNVFPCMAANCIGRRASGHTEAVRDQPMLHASGCHLAHGLDRILCQASEMLPLAGYVIAVALAVVTILFGGSPAQIVGAVIALVAATVCSLHSLRRLAMESTTNKSVQVQGILLAVPVKGDYVIAPTVHGRLDFSGCASAAVHNDPPNTAVSRNFIVREARNKNPLHAGILPQRAVGSKPLLALAILLTMTACAPWPDAGPPETEQPKAHERPKFEPVPLPLMPSWWRLIST